MTKTSTALLLLALASLLAGCTTNPNVLQIHKVTAEAIGLASTDELTMGPVTKSKEDFLGGAELNFKADRQGPCVQLLDGHDSRHPT